MNRRSLARGEVREKSGVWYAKNLCGTFFDYLNREAAEKFAQSRTEYFQGGGMRFHYPPDPNLIEVPLGPAWRNERGRIAMRLPRKQVTNAPEGFLNEEQFVERLLTAQALVLADRLAKWTKGSATTTTRSPTRIPSCLDRFSNRGNATMLGSIKSSN